MKAIVREIIMTSKNQSLKISSILNLERINKKKTARIKANIIWDKTKLYSGPVSGLGVSRPKGKILFSAA